jgi:hypothetical protein
MKVIIGIILGLILFGSIGALMFLRIDLFIIGLLVVILGSILFKSIK